MTLSTLTIQLDRNFAKMDSVAMKNKIKYIAAEYMGKYYWLDETYSIICWDGQNESVVAPFCGKKDMIMLHRLILTGEKRYVNPLH